MENWFEDVFLKSLKARYTGTPIWLTQKQTAVCLREMKQNIRTSEYGTQLYYTYRMGEYNVCLDYSKRNGCGSIGFSFDGPRQNRITPQRKRALEQERKNANRAISDLNDYKSEWDEEDKEEVLFWEKRLEEIAFELSMPVVAI